MAVDRKPLFFHCTSDHKAIRHLANRSGSVLQFILEGLIPVLMSFFVWKLLPDNPETASFLDKHEKEYIINRLALETGSGKGRVTNNDKIQMHHVMAALKEYKIWGAWVMFWANTIGVYGYVSTILRWMSSVY